jgi:hypothetical protein
LKRKADLHANKHLLSNHCIFFEPLLIKSLRFEIERGLVELLMISFKDAAESSLGSNSCDMKRNQKP